MGKHHKIGYRLVLLALMLLPALALGGGGAGRVEAGARTGSVPTGTSTARPETLLLRVYFRSIAERDSLAAELGAEEVPTTDHFLTILGDRPMLSNLQARGLRVEIDEAESKRLNDPNLFAKTSPDTFYGGYKTVEEMQTFLDEQVASHPGFAEKVDFGDSWCKTHPGVCNLPSPTWNGYDLFALHITNQAIPGPKPVYWYDAGIHSREIATPEVAMRFISWLLDNYDSDPDARWLVDYQDIWVVPMLNPDGHHIVEAGGGGGSPYYQRKNADKLNGCTVYPPTSSNQFGTDLNRNWPFQWGCCGGSSGSPCTQTYRGPTAGSEEETMFGVAKISSLIPDQRGPNPNDPAPITTTGAVQSMHSYANLNLYPWGHTTQPAPNGPDMRNIGMHMSAGNAFPSGNSYQTCQPPECLYAVDGDSTTWAYGELGVPAFTTELEGGTFLPPYSQVNSIWLNNKGMLTYMAKVSRMPYLMAHGPDSRTVTTVPMTVTQGSPVQLLANINYAWSGNAYSQNVGDAEYYVDTPPWAGGTPGAMQPSDGNFDSPTEGVEAMVDTSTLPPGRHILFVRGRGLNSYGGFPTWGPMSAAFLDVTGGGGTPTATVVSTSTAVATSTATVGASATPTPCVVGTVDVSIGNFFFNPQTETIAAGSTVRWTNTGGTHTTTSDTGVWDSGTLPVGGTFSFTFNTPGTYPYHCNIHPGSMTGTIIVTGPCPTTPTVTSTFTPVPTLTSVATSTTVATSTRSPVPPSSTTTSTAAVTETATVATTNTAAATNTAVAGTATATGTAVAGTATSTTVAGTATPTACNIQFEDVPPSNTFYTFVRCLACRNIIGGYPCGGAGEPCNANNDPYFRYNNPISRGQIAKIVALSAGIDDPAGTRVYEDVPEDSPFYLYIQQLSNRSYVGGYLCGQTTAEPCVPPGMRPYFRPQNNASRGQLSKIVSNAAMIETQPSGQTYADVPLESPFRLYIERLSALNVMGGYPCGGPGEPCDEQNRPYFRPNATVTRGQASKITANTFFPNCAP